MQRPRGRLGHDIDHIIATVAVGDGDRAPAIRVVPDAHAQRCGVQVHRQQQQDERPPAEHPAPQTAGSAEAGARAAPRVRGCRSGGGGGHGKMVQVGGGRGERQGPRSTIWKDRGAVEPFHIVAENGAPDNIHAHEQNTEPRAPAPGAETDPPQRQPSPT